MNNSFKVEIYTPTGKYFSGDVSYLSVSSPLGVLGILPDHAPLVTTLEICKLTTKINSNELKYAIGGGVMNIKKDNHIVLLVNSIERSDEINVARAKESKKRAEERLAKSSEEIDIKRAQLSLSRALNRLSVSGE